MTSFLFEIFFYKLLILCRIHQTERLENIIEIFPLRPLMEEIQAIIPAKDAVDVLILTAVPNYRFGSFLNSWGNPIPKESKYHRARGARFARDATNPVSSGIFE